MYPKIPGRNSAFSFYEVIIVVAILSALTLTTIASYQTTLAKARDALRKSNLKKLHEAITNYYDAQQTYPSLPQLSACGQPLRLNSYTYLPSIPCDPLTHQPYYFEFGSDPANFFRIYAILEYKKDEIIRQLKCHRGCAKSAGCIYNYGVTSTNTTVEKCYDPEIWACSPGGGSSGVCERYEDLVKSACPISFEEDPTCRNLCSKPVNRCQNNSGKIPDPHQTPTSIATPTPKK